MLKLILFKHEGSDFSDEKLGMCILIYQRCAFERQINEGVKIEKESKTSEILNSKAEWNQSQLPRLITRVGNTDEELKSLEKELETERKMEEKLERNLGYLEKKETELD